MLGQKIPVTTNWLKADERRSQEIACYSRNISNKDLIRIPIGDMLKYIPKHVPCIWENDNITIPALLKTDLHCGL